MHFKKALEKTYRIGRVAVGKLEVDVLGLLGKQRSAKDDSDVLRRAGKQPRCDDAHASRDREVLAAVFGKKARHKGLIHSVFVRFSAEGRKHVRDGDTRDGRLRFVRIRSDMRRHDDLVSNVVGE